MTDRQLLEHILKWLVRAEENSYSDHRIDISMLTYNNESGEDLIERILAQIDGDDSIRYWLL